MGGGEKVVGRGEMVFLGVGGKKAVGVEGGFL